MLREGFPVWDGDSDERLQSAGGMFDRHGRVHVKTMYYCKALRTRTRTRTPEGHPEVNNTTLSNGVV